MSEITTSGEWEVIDSQNEGANSVRIFSGDTYLATVGGSDQSMETIVANARLIVNAVNEQNSRVERTTQTS